MIPARKQIAAAIVGQFILVGASALAQDSATESRVVRLVEQRCVKCHGEEVTNAGVDLSDFKGDLEVWKYRRTFTKVLDMLERNLMPPEEEPELREAGRRDRSWSLSYYHLVSTLLRVF